MAAVNNRRVLLGAVAGGVVWLIWSTLIQMLVLGPKYAAGQQAGLFLKQPRYSAFPVIWTVMLFVLSYIVSWLYASARATRGANAGTAFKIGLFVGFAGGFPLNFAISTWSPMSRVFPLWWMLELWVGAILATMVAGWLYRDQTAASA
jgi:hypothetical protein